MKIIIAICVFCLVLFIYLHIQFHLKKGEDLEMYETENPSKDKLEEICNLRQPVLFDFDCQKIVDTSNRTYIANNYNIFEVKIRNILDTDESDLHVPLPLHSAIKLFDEDKSASYLTENNNDFLEETGLIKNFRYNDEFLRPYMVSNCRYDIMMGAKNIHTPFRYQLNYRNYLLLTQGSAQIKLAPPHSAKYLFPIYDYENFEFRSPVNPWKPQTKFSADFDKVKCLEFTLLPGKTLYIPAYWWYSIKFNHNTSISCFNYRTYINNLTILPSLCLHVLQIQNIKRTASKKININEINKPDIVYPDDNINTDSTIIIESNINTDLNINTESNIIKDINTNLDPNINTEIIKDLETHIFRESTNIDDLPQPISSSESTIGTEI
jgi:signal recognition particle subunit SEC65